MDTHNALVTAINTMFKYCTLCRCRHTPGNWPCGDCERREDAMDELKSLLDPDRPISAKQLMG